MLCSGDYVELLLSRKVDELNRIAGYTDREVCVLWLLRVLHRILQLLYAEDVYIHMVCALCEVTIHNANEGVRLLVLGMAECARVDGLGVGDTIECILVWKLRNRVQGSQKTGLLCAVAWVCSR